MNHHQLEMNQQQQERIHDPSLTVDFANDTSQQGLTFMSKLSLGDSGDPSLKAGTSILINKRTSNKVSIGCCSTSYLVIHIHPLFWIICHFFSYHLILNVYFCYFHLFFFFFSEVIAQGLASLSLICSCVPSIMFIPVSSVSFKLLAIFCFFVFPVCLFHSSFILLFC